MENFKTTTEEQLWLALDQALQGWSKSLEIGGHEPEGHGYRVAEMTMLLAQKIGLPSSEIVHMVRGALLHDIGKLAIPDTILLKPGKLDETERALVEQHPVYGKQMLEPIEFLRPAIDIPYCHHERWDGKGYPRGLTGEDIPLPARLFAIVDVWDVLSFDQPYREAWPQEMVLDHLETAAGTHFDPDLVPEFLMIVNDVNPKDRVVARQEPAKITSVLRAMA
ncbi:MAG: HD-GYP domain-containing protein [Fimbriimonadaceae bacterium]